MRVVFSYNGRGALRVEYPFPIIYAALDNLVVLFGAEDSVKLVMAIVPYIVVVVGIHLRRGEILLSFK